MTRIPRRGLGALLALAVVAAACSSGPATPPPVGTAGLPSGSGQPGTNPSPAASAINPGSSGTAGGPNPIPIAGANVTIMLPNGWLAFDSKTSPIVVHTTIDSHPIVADTLGSLLDNSVRFVGFDAAATGGGRPATVTIKRIGDAIPSEDLLMGLAQATATQIQGSQPVSGKITYQDAQLTNGPAVEMSYAVKPANGENLALDVFLVSVGDGTYLVSFAVPADVMSGFQPVFRNVVQTFMAG